MTYCLRCNAPCSDLNPSGSEPPIFCDKCQSLLRNRLQRGDMAETPRDFDLLYTSLWQEEHEQASLPPLQSTDPRDGQPPANIQNTAAGTPIYGMFAAWRSQASFSVLPSPASFLQAASSSDTQLSTLQSPDAGVQPGHADLHPHLLFSQVSLAPASKLEQGTSLYAWPQLKQHGRESTEWTNQVDPLVVRLNTNKLTSTPVEKQAIWSNAETVTRPTINRGATRSVEISRRIAFGVLALLVVFALAASGAIAFQGVLQTQQQNAERSAPSPMLTATAHTAQLPAPTGQSPPSSSPAGGVVQPVATVSSALKAPTPAPSGATSPTSRLPIVSVSSSALTFSAPQGQANPSGQAVYIANTGGSSLNWKVSIDSSATSWLSIATNKGTVAASQTGQVMVRVNIAGLTPGLYSANLTITVSDSSDMQVQGSPHVVAVTLIVAQLCTWQVTPPNLSFTVSLLQPNSSGQTITLIETGNCAFPISWKASADQSWISLSATAGTDDGSGSALTVRVKANSLSLGNCSGQITLSAVGSGGATVENSLQTISVTMTVSLL